MDRAGRHQVRWRWREELLGFAWACAMQLEASTWRYRVIDRNVIDELSEAGERALVVIWHGHYRPVLASVRDRPCMVVSTDTFRGRIIEAAVRHLGHRCVLRPPALRGEQALAWMCTALREAPRVVLVADGPAGPARRVKRGVVQLASRLRFRVVPCAAASAWSYTRQRWDDQEIPVPFSKVAVFIGEPFARLPPAIGEAETARWRECLGQAIDECRSHALAIVGRRNGG